MDISKQSDLMTSATMAQDGFLVQTLTREFLGGLGAVAFIHLLVARCSGCWLGTVSLTINQSFVQLKTPRKHWGFLGFWLRCQLGFRSPLQIIPSTQHPGWLPASPDASEASDVIQRCPSHGM